jgi:hypothetical protein
MGEKTGISWCDATWNCWQGCHKVSPGCKNCYMFAEKSRYGQNPGIVVRSSDSTFNAPLKWAKNPEKYGHIKRIFVDSWSDFFIQEADQGKNMNPDSQSVERRVLVKEALSVLSWVGAGLNMADALNLLYPEEASRMEMMNLFPGPRFFVNSKY